MIHLLTAVMVCLQGGAAEREIESKLKNLKLTLDFKESTLDALADYVRDVADLNIVVSPKIETRDGVTIKVSDLSLKSILSLVLKPRGLICLLKDGVLQITVKEDEPVVLEIYDVRDLMYTPPDFIAPEIDLDSTKPGVICDFGMPTEAPPDFPLEELVRAHAGGRSWEENPKTTLKLSNGLLVVKQTKSVQAEIRRMLGQMRTMK
jgi:hypothetical protein